MIKEQKMSDLKIQAIDKIKPLLPTNVINALNRLDSATLYSITELRLRADGICTITINAQNCVLSSSGVIKELDKAIRVTKEELDAFIFKLCKGSVYSHETTLKDGYITRFGIRIGICGTYSYSGNSQGFSKILGVNIRLPHHVAGCSRQIMKYISENGFPDGKGILIASAPGVGKTTLLRDLAANLSGGFMQGTEQSFLRVCVIDERYEIFMEEVFCNCAADFLSGMPKAKGIETATRVMSAQVIICDEIGTQTEAEEMLHASSGGVVLIASVHANSEQSAYAKPHIKALVDAGVFGAIYCLERKGNTVSGKLYTIKGQAEKNIVSHNESANENA